MNGWSREILIKALMMLKVGLGWVEDDQVSHVYRGDCEF